MYHKTKVLKFDGMACFWSSAYALWTGHIGVIPIIPFLQSRVHRGLRYLWYYVRHMFFIWSLGSHAALSALQNQLGMRSCTTSLGHQQKIIRVFRLWKIVEIHMLHMFTLIRLRNFSVILQLKEYLSSILSISFRHRPGKDSHSVIILRKNTTVSLYFHNILKQE